MYLMEGLNFQVLSCDRKISKQSVALFLLKATMDVIRETKEFTVSINVSIVLVN
jgi:hypothetical protein